MTQRLLSSVAASFDEWDGQLLLRGVDIRKWTVIQMLNAAEAQLYAACADDKERTKVHGRLYAPPRGALKTVRSGVGPQDQATPARPAQRRTGLQASSVADLLSQIQAEDSTWKSG